MYTTVKRAPVAPNRIGQLIVTGIVVLILGVWLFPRIDPVTKLKKAFMSETSFYRNQGDDSLAAEEYRQAVINYTRSIKADESNADAWHGRARAYCMMGRFNRCLSDVSQAIVLRPDDPALYFERSNIFHNDSKWDEALADLDKSLELDPKRFDSLLARAMTLRFIGRLEEAIMDYTAALEAAPWGMDKKELATIYAERGMAFYGSNQLDKAIADFHKTLDVWPDAKRSFVWQLPVLNQQLAALEPGKEVMKGELERLIARIEGSE